MTQKMKIDIIVPIYYNNNKPIEYIVLEDISNMILEKFGGLTVFSGLSGYWKQDNKIYQDESLLYSIVMDDNNVNNQALIKLKDYMRIQLRQIEIFMTKSSLEVI
jgi:hypothetical protein